MATTVVPIIAAGLGALGPIIADIGIPIIKIVQAHFPASGAGKSKMATVLSVVQTILQDLATGGNLPAPPPAADSLQQTIEGLLACLKLYGDLPAAGSGIAAAAPVAPVAPSSSGQILNIPLKIVWGGG